MFTRATLSLVLAAGAVVSAAGPDYTIVKEIQIGGEGGWDYIVADAAAHRLYVSHATKIVVADTETGAIVGEIADTPGRPRHRPRARARARLHEQRPRATARRSST